MVLYQGIESAPALEIAPCGLFSVARVVKHSADDTEWLRGFAVESNAFPTIKLQSNNGSALSNNTISAGTPGSDYKNVLPFWIELDFTQTTIDFIREEFGGASMDQIDSATQKAVEREFWEGVATRGNTPAGTDGYLIKSGTPVVGAGTGQSADRALALIEQSISNSPTGGRGVIHMTPDVASTLGSHLKYVEKNEIDGKTFAVTRLGTLVVIGHGYTGSGPVGATGAGMSDTNRWIYSTGGVEVHLGVPEYTNSNLAQAFNFNVNDFVVQILRPAAVHFDPSIHYAARVTLS